MGIRPSQCYPFLNSAQAGGETGIFLVSVYFLSQKQLLRPLGYCGPPYANVPHGVLFVDFLSLTYILNR